MGSTTKNLAWPLEFAMNQNQHKMPADIHIGFIGAGRMAQALVSGVVSSDLPIASIGFVDPQDEAGRLFKNHAPNAIRFADIAGLVQASEVLVMAVKPQMFPEVLEAMVDWVTPEHLIVSVAAGITIQKIESGLNTHRVVRVMPNTPCLIGKGVSALSHDPAVDAETVERVKKILESVGEVVLVNESQMDAVTGLSGSGPAYVFSFIEALVQAGASEGLTGDLAQQLALSTLKGAVALVESTGLAPAELRQQVTSPNGTTLAGLQAMESAGFSNAVKAAVHQAAARSRELSG